MMDKTTIEIPTELLQAAGITPDEVKKELAIRLYQLHKLNDRQAGELAGDPNIIESLVWRNTETGHFDLDEFLDWASHDLKTPLNSVIGFTKVVLKGIDGPINETQETDLNTVFTAGQRTLALLSQLVEIARLNKGRMMPSKTEFDISELVTETGNRWKTANLSKALHVELNIKNSAVDLDKAQLKQIISHLLTFASIRVTEGIVSLSASDSEDTLNFRFQSEGKKTVDKSEMESAMLTFITTSMIKLNRGQMDTPQETEDGLILSFSLPRYI